MTQPTHEGGFFGKVRPASEPHGTTSGIVVRRAPDATTQGHGTTSGIVVRRGEESGLAVDLSNFDTVDLGVYRAALEGPQGLELLRRTRDTLIQIQRAGRGVNLGTLPPTLRQSGVECQTIALLNGIQAWNGREAVASLVPQIPQIRAEAAGLALARRGNPEGGSTMVAVEEALAERGLLEPYNIARNVVPFARDFFHGDRFVGVSNDGGAWHAYSVIPLQASDDPNAFAVKLDSLGGQTTVLSPDDFIKLFVGRRVDEYQNLYGVVKNNTQS